MKRNDWIGIGVSAVLHAALLFVFAIATAGAVDPEPIGYIEVDFGPISEGQPVQRADETRAAETEQPPAPQPQEEEEAAPPEDTKPVDLPDHAQIRDDEKIDSPEAENTSPETQNNQADVIKPDPQPEQQPIEPRGGGAEGGATGATEGDDGEGAEPEKAAPFNIEGLNRTPVTNPLPLYTEKVNATIRIRITVDPQGRIVGRIPLLKGSPALEQSVMDALQRWRFNALPPNAPQENQTGTITFRFRLE